MFSASELINSQMPGSNGSIPGNSSGIVGTPLDPLSPNNPVTPPPTSDPTTWPKEDPGNSSLSYDVGLNRYQEYLDYMNSAREADYAYNSQEAAKNREWQQFMSSTSYQRMVNDLKAAGLNPWLAVQSGGSGASMGSGGAASSNSAVSAGSAFGDYASSNTASGRNLVGRLGAALISGVSSLASSVISRNGSIVNGIAHGFMNLVSSALKLLG